MKARLDAYLVEAGYAQSREKAKAMVIAKQVLVDNKPAKPSLMVNENNNIIVKEHRKYVSRGGLKIEKAFAAFDIRVQGKTACDIGASTGGFTDCLLKNGAVRVFSVDVGYGQLDYTLRTDSRVTVMERVNARNLTPDMFDGPIEFACMDVSFISIKLILPALIPCLQPGSDIVALIKPQFEAGRDKVGKNGIVRDKTTHLEILKDFREFFMRNDISLRGMDFSPITGQQGNIEFICHLKNLPYEDIELDFEAIIDSAHNSL